MQYFKYGLLFALATISFGHAVLFSKDLYLTAIFKQVVGDEISIICFPVNFNIANAPSLPRFAYR